MYQAVGRGTPMQSPSRDHRDALRLRQLTLIWTAALILIGGFAVLARYVLLPSAPG